MKYLLVTILVALLVPGCTDPDLTGESPGADNAQPSDATVTGVVHDSRGKAVYEAVVTAADSTATADADDQGRFSLSIEPGGVALQVHWRHYLLAQRDLQVSGATLDLGVVSPDHAFFIEGARWFQDGDGDGYHGRLITHVVQPADFEAWSQGSTLGEDCDDANGLVNPGAIEVADNGIDDDCDGEEVVSAGEPGYSAPDQPVLVFDQPVGDTAGDEAPSGCDDPQAQANCAARADLRECGSENEVACALSQAPLHWLSRRCDTGLGPVLRKTARCGCLLRNPLNGRCVEYRTCLLCVNDTRRRQNVTTFDGSWAQWALRNQTHRLSIDEPLNWVTRMGSHNAFNTQSDGFVWPNHYFSMTDQLDAGARSLNLDLHTFDGRLVVCHGGDHCGLTGYRLFSGAVHEIANWLAGNPNEIVMLTFENQADEANVPAIEEVIRSHLGGLVYRPLGANPPASTDQPWPSRRELLAQGSRVIVFDKFDASTWMWPQPRSTPPQSGYFGSEYPNNTRHTYRLRPPDTAEQCGYNVIQNPDLRFNTILMPFERGYFLNVEEERFAVKTGALPQPEAVYILDPRRHIYAYESAAAARCNFSVINLDLYRGGRVNHLPEADPGSTRAFQRIEGAVWSWREGDRGDNGNCALLQAASNRWVSRGCGTTARFLCGRPRSESGTGERSGWRRAESDWLVTETAGRWSEGVAACPPGYAFSVPVNGYQNRFVVQRQVQLTGGPRDIWLNYRNTPQTVPVPPLERRLEELLGLLPGEWPRTRTVSNWHIPKRAGGPGNRPPNAVAGANQIAECGATVTLDGSFSSDPDNDALSYTWRGSFGDLDGAVVDVVLPFGRHLIELVVEDSAGASDRDHLEVSIFDTLPPQLSVTLTPDRLWPPNRRLVTIDAHVQSSDDCDPDAVFVELTGIVSSDPEDESEHAGYQHAPDIAAHEIGTLDTSFQVRAERSHPHVERVYTASYRATDVGGNVTESSVTVTVPDVPPCHHHAGSSSPHCRAAQ